MSNARQFHTIEGKFKMRHGVLKAPVIAYETWGELNAARDNAVLIFTGLSPSAHAASSPEDRASGWWEQMLGQERPIDTDKYFVICVNSLGSCFGSTGPASINPVTGRDYRLTFPVLTIEDIASAGFEVIRSMGITKLDTVIGCSMGGMTALAFSVMYPNHLESLVSISSAARALPFTIAIRSVQREIIRSDPEWRRGDYADHGPNSGMRLARKLGMLSYRSAAEFEKRFGRELVKGEHDSDDAFGIDFEVESYLEAHANKFIGTFDANCYLYLSRAMDLFDIADHGGSVAIGLGKSGAQRALVIGVETDMLFPLKQQREIADGLRAAGCEVTYHEMDSLQGHDAFLVDMDQFRPVICDFFNCPMKERNKRVRSLT